MQGSERPYRQLLDTGALARHLVPQNSMFAFLAAHRPEVFTLAAAGMPSGCFDTAILARPPGSPPVARKPPPSGYMLAGSWGGRGSPIGSLTGCRRNNRPATPSDGRLCNARSNRASNHIWRHPATKEVRLTVKQVHMEFALGSADPWHRRHRHCPTRRC
jgi:hypothetical protein